MMSPSTYRVFSPRPWIGSAAHVVAAVVLACGLGCQAPGEPAAPLTARVSAETPADLEAIWEAATDTLLRNSFQLDRQDRLAGVLTTHPETSAAFFELWRPQPRPAYLWWESNLHTIQRQAAVTIRPVEEGREYDVTVQVERFRYSFEERQIDNPLGALRLYSSEAPTVRAGELRRLGESSDWIPLGRDPFMEEALLSSILERSGLSTWTYAPPAAATRPAS